MTQSNIKWVPLSEFIEPFKKKCGDSDAKVSGVDINKQFIDTRAVMDGIDVSKYYLVPPKHFACNLMHIGRDERLPIAYNSSDDNLVVTSAYYVFCIKESKREEILDEFLYIFFNSKEIDRLTWFYTDSSVRGNLKESRFLDILIPIPSIDAQRRIVDTWTHLREVKEQNESIAEPLFQLCHSYIQELKREYELKPIGGYIRNVTEKNSDLEITLEQGINIKKEFITPQRSNSNLATRVKVRKGQFAYCTQLNNENVAIAYRTGEDCVVSPVYEVFEIIDETLVIPEYLFLWLIRPEFGRFVYWGSVGSAYEFLRWEDLSSSRIAIPSIEIQQAIVNIFHCAKEAKRIAEEADKLSREICPALIQKVIHE